jgi:superfamily II DNA helicase RecQ
MLTYADVFMVYLLECLQKTSPPAIIFCENKADVDDIHEYLLLKGVNAGTKVLAYWYKSTHVLVQKVQILTRKQAVSTHKRTCLLVQQCVLTRTEVQIPRSEHTHDGKSLFFIFLFWTVSTHGGKSQEDREFAMKAFKTGRADVIIATGAQFTSFTGTKVLALVVQKLSE